MAVKMKRDILLGILFLAGFVGFAVWLNQPMEGSVPTAASKLVFEKGHVSDIIGDNASPDYWTEGLRIGVQQVMITIDSGTWRDVRLPVNNYLNAYGNVDLEKDTSVIVRLDYDEGGDPYIVSVANYNRVNTLGTLGLVFAALLIGFGGKKGLSAILGLIFTVLSIWFVLIPLMERGLSSVLSAIIVVAVTTVVSLVLLNGITKKTLCAAIGCISGVTVAGLVASIAGVLSPINGFNMAEAEELVLRGGGDIKISGLLVSGILIASLGAVMDVSLTITSAVVEIKQHNPKARHKTLFRSGLNIGRDAMGTMANTLILAFAGASLNMLVLFKIFDYPYLQVFNSDLMTIEIIQGLAGSIGIVLTVPLVAGLSAFVYGKKSVR